MTPGQIAQALERQLDVDLTGGAVVKKTGYQDNLYQEEEEED